VPRAKSDEEYLFVDVDGVATIVIKADDEGIVVDVYPLPAGGDPVASTYALYSELTGETNEDTAPP
jgi:hypothetical protein